MKIYSVINMKGGVAKTTTVQQLGIGFARAGHRTLLIDADPQGNLTSLVLPEIEFDESAEELLSGERKNGEKRRTLIDLLDLRCADPSECVYATKYPGLDLVPSNLDLSNTIYDLQNNASAGMPQLRMKKQIAKLGEYDIVLIDNSPALNMMTINTIYASDRIIIPTALSNNSIKGMIMTFRQCQRMIEELDQDKIYEFRILLTMMNRNRSETRLASLIRERFPEYVCDTVIRYQSAPIRRAEENDTALIDDTQSKVAGEYRDLIDEFLRERKEH